MFAWLRPNDLIWNYWVNNYLLGHAPKAFDILYWNADPVRMTAAMHRDFMDLAIRNSLTEPGGAQMLGTDVDLGKVDIDSYVVAGIADHLCKWESCYQTHPAARRRLEVRAVHQRAHRGDGEPARQREGELPDSSTQPRRRAGVAGVRQQGQGQLVGRLRRAGSPSAPVRSATSRRRLGSAAYEPICDAPGTYVHDR